MHFKAIYRIRETLCNVMNKYRKIECIFKILDTNYTTSYNFKYSLHTEAPKEFQRSSQLQMLTDYYYDASILEY